jgi:hypothetical protein
VIEIHEVVTREIAKPSSVERLSDDVPSCDDATLELVVRAQMGDYLAVEAILQRCLPPLKRWAHGRLPAAARRAHHRPY